MEPSAETIALVALLRRGLRSPSEYAELVESAGSAVQLTDAELALLAPQLREEAMAAIVGWMDQGMRLVTLLDDCYPENLRMVHDRPPLIFVSGCLACEDARSVAVIGSRRATPEGREIAHALAGLLAAEGFTLVSGLARGIDTAAHIGALEQGGRTVAVIGTGLDQCYPPENAPLQQRIASEGAVVSQFWPGSVASRQSFPMRNAVMSGLSLANVIVEASHRSGARAQARMALAHGRPVFLFDRLLHDDWARELASRPGVSVVGSPGQVVVAAKRLATTGTLVQ